MWILRPFLTKKNNNKANDTENGNLNLNQSDYKLQKNTYMMILTLILILLAFFLLPKFGINYLALLQKIISTVSSLRGILPY